MRVHSIALACAVLPLAALAGGETVPCPEHKAGEWFRYAKTNLAYGSRSEHVARIERVDGDRLRGTNEEGLPVVADRILNPSTVGTRHATPKFYRLPECPFALGEVRVYKDVDYDGFGPGSRERGTFTLTIDPEFTAVTVPAGTFKVVRVVSELAYVSAGVQGSARAESFYAPALGVSVQHEFREEPLPGRLWHFRYELLESSSGK